MGTKNEEVEKEACFPKEKLITSKKYRENVDLLNVLLEDKKQYTFAEVDSIIEKFNKKVVK